MKKLISLLCVLAITAAILAVGVVSASADVPATVAEVKKGDKVSYSLYLSDCPEKIIGYDMSVYYDPSVLTVDSILDFTGTEDWEATINDKNGEIFNNWTRTKGIDFSKKRQFITVNFTATKDASAHISYFVRFLYDEPAFQAGGRAPEKYVFTCDLTVNGEVVAQNALPELNVETKTATGKFENSRTGNSNDADSALTSSNIKDNGGAKDDTSKFKGENNVNVSAEDYNSGNGASNNSGNKSGGNSGNNAGNQSGGNSGNNAGNKPDSTDNKKDAKATDGKSGTVVDQSVTESTKNNDGSGMTAVPSDANGKIEDNADNTESTAAKKEGGSPLMWIIIAAIVVIAGGCIGYVIYKGKKKDSPEDKPTDGSDNTPQ